MPIRFLLLLTSISMLNLGCTVGPVVPQKVLLAKAVAELVPIDASGVSGRIILAQVDQTLEIDIEASGLTPGKHGIHVHNLGDCSGEGAKNAGPHFSLGPVPHGGPNHNGGHNGDLGNVEADEKGRVKARISVKNMMLMGPANITGKSIVIHGAEDDLKTQPAGNSGPRVACGVIVLTH